MVKNFKGIPLAFIAVGHKKSCVKMHLTQPPESRMK